MNSSDTSTPLEKAAALHGVSVRTIKRWRAAGRVHEDPPPLQTPAEMPAWVARMQAKGAAGFVHRPPQMGMPARTRSVRQQASAGLYRVSVRKIKRWVATGRAHNDPPPLLKPAEMPAWASRMHGRKVPGFKHRPVKIEVASAAGKTRKSLACATGPDISPELFPEFGDK